MRGDIPLSSCVPAYTNGVRKMNLRKFKTLVKLVKKEFFSIFCFKIAKNNVYSKEDYLNAFLYLTQRHSAYSGSAQMRYLKEQSPDSDSMLYTLRKSPDSAYQDLLIEITDKLLNMCFKIGVFKRSYEFDVGIDYHDRPYHGDKNDEGVVGSKKEPHWAYRFATIDIIEKGCTFTIFMLPFKELDSDKNIVNKLLSEAKKRIRINCLYADAEFMSAELIDTYEKQKINYIVRAKSSYVYKIEAQHEKSTSFEYVRKRYVNKYPVTTKTTWVINIFEKYGEIKKESYYTNLKVTKRTIDQFYLQYDKRWNIEIDYRTNNNFMPRTCTKSYTIRVFYFILSLIMRNVLMYINLLLKQKSSMWYSERALLSSFNFVFLIAIVPHLQK